MRSKTIQIRQKTLLKRALFEAKVEKRKYCLQINVKKFFQIAQELELLILSFLFQNTQA